MNLPLQDIYLETVKNTNKEIFKNIKKIDKKVPLCNFLFEIYHEHCKYYHLLPSFNKVTIKFSDVAKSYGAITQFHSKKNLYVIIFSKSLLNCVDSYFWVMSHEIIHIIQWQREKILGEKHSPHGKLFKQIMKEMNNRYANYLGEIKLKIKPLDETSRWFCLCSQCGLFLGKFHIRSKEKPHFRCPGKPVFLKLPEFKKIYFQSYCRKCQTTVGKPETFDTFKKHKPCKSRLYYFKLTEKK